MARNRTALIPFPDTSAHNRQRHTRDHAMNATTDTNISEDLTRKVAYITTLPAWANDYTRYQRMDNEVLMQEYLTLQKSCFGRNIFCGNAKQARTLVAFVLLRRG